MNKFNFKKIFKRTFIIMVLANDKNLLWKNKKVKCFFSWLIVAFAFFNIH